MKKNIFKRGFTLIELLVVIAIIGILAAVVLASLNSARDKGEDAAAKSALNNARAQAELFYDDAGRSYLNVCTTGQAGNGIDDLYQNAMDSVSAVDGTSANCVGTSTAWAAEVLLNSGDWYCVDFRGNATTSGGSSIGTNDPICA